MTPISSLDYSPAADITKRYVIKKNYIRRNTAPTAGLMAKYTISRSMKKTVITALSMSVSVVLFMLIATLCDYIIEYTESNMQFTDYIVKLNHTYSISDGEGNPYDFSYFSDGDSVKLGDNDYRIVKSDYVSPCFRITGWIDSTVYRAVLYLPESSFIAEFGDGLTYAMLVNAKDDCYDLLCGELERLNVSFMTAVDSEINESYVDESIESGLSALETLSFSAGIEGRMDGLEQMKQTVISIRTVGYSLSAMIFLIGTLNIVNTALSSAAERRREFAMLEAVGMTDKQLMRMLLTESLYIGGAAVLITVCAGFPLIALIINTAMDAIVKIHWQSGVIMLAVCISVSVFSGIAVFRMTKSFSVVERIKVD